MAPKALKKSEFPRRTDVGAIRSAGGGFGRFLGLSAVISTGFSADSPEN
jgi:hypothetical protein